MDQFQQQSHSPVGGSYDFILNPQHPPKKKMFGFGGNSNFLLTIGLIIGGALVCMVIVALVINLLGGSSNKASFVSIAQTQQELVRVADQGAQSAVQQTTKNLAATIQYGITTQQKQTLAFLARAGETIKDPELRLKQNATTDQQLAAAKSTSTFDATFTQLAQKQLTDYANSLKQVHASAKNQTEKELLSTFYSQTQLIISQIPYTQDNLKATQQ